MKRKGGDNDITEEEIKMIKKSKIEEKEFFTINIFIISFDILKEIFKFIFYNNKKDMINLRLCCKTFRNLCSPYWKQSIPSLYLDKYLENINRMEFEIGELNIVEINYSNIFSKLPKDLTKLTVHRETNSKDLQYLPASIEYLNLDNMDFLNIHFSDIPKTVKFLTLEYEFVENLKDSDLNFIKDFKNPNIYLQKYVDINNNYYKYKPLLFFSIANDSKEYLSYLLKKGANINQKNNNGQSALIYATKKRCLEMVKILLEKGANINEKDNINCNSLIYACEYGCLEIVKLLIQYGANINVKDSYGLNLLIYTTKYKHLEIVKLLLEKGLNINGKDNSIETSALMLASKYGSLELVKLLFENGANINQNNIFGDSALLFATNSEQLEIIDFLLEKGANINQKNIDGTNALMIASREGYLEIVQLLIENGMDKNEKDKNENTALQYAKENNQIEIINYFETLI